MKDRRIHQAWPARLIQLRNNRREQVIVSQFIVEAWSGIKQNVSALIKATQPEPIFIPERTGLFHRDNDFLVRNLHCLPKPSGFGRPQELFLREPNQGEALQPREARALRFVPRRLLVQNAEEPLLNLLFIWTNYDSRGRGGRFFCLPTLVPTQFINNSAKS